MLNVAVVHSSRIFFFTSAIILFIVCILGRCVVGGFPRLGPSRGDCQTPSATVAESASVWPLSHGHSVPLPSATALGLGFHRWPCSTCQPIMGSWREPIWILQVASSSDLHPTVALCPHARSSSEVMLSVPIRTESLGTCISIQISPNPSRYRFPCFPVSIRIRKETLRSYFVIKSLRRFLVWYVHDMVPSCRSHPLGIE